MALSRHHAALTRPLSIPEIVAQAQDFEYTNARPFQQWLRAGQMLLTEAAICERDGKIQIAYLYLYRHAQLFLDRLPQHPDYKDPNYRKDLARARKALQKNLEKLEEWKPRIDREYQRYFKAIERRDAERQRVLEERERKGVQRRRSGEDSWRRRSTQSDEGVLDDGIQALRANEHSQLAVDLAHMETRRRDATRQTTTQAGVSPGAVASRRRGIVVGDDNREEPVDDQSDGVREAGRHLYGRGSRQQPPSRQVANGNTTGQPYHYPTVPGREGAIDWKMPSLQPTPIQALSGPPPARPAKEGFESTIPALPPKVRDPQSEKPPTASPSPLLGKPTAASKYTFKPTASTEAGVPLRTVMLPPDLRTTFLNLAHRNTSRNLETCGILCGTLISNALFINHLIIPDQTSTSDTCDTTESGDNALFDYCDSHELLVCGWIHTHPSQSCFLSSRDLHTSSGYQVMLPEAIAIVCAPRQNPDWGIFRLTDPPGLPHVLNCHQSGLFHPHSEANLYTDALRPGHVVEGPGLKFDVVDMRK
ncbi:hypothetical protein B0A50_06025 [Salinomyces thailandicus]|uniref:MPN domain-containing protein n=1 Tax=Salinomyces thailandicus TaxID=706561 RepID=A0A4U0TQ81_9PEZI|nr:hypothetical protein B0A50_06025 [Salinomyces thailandica]